MKKHYVIALLMLGALGAYYSITHFHTVTAQTAAVFDALNNDVAVASCIEAQELDTTDFTTQYINLSTTGDQLLVRLSADPYCGTAGCQFRLCNVTKAGTTVIPFGYAGIDIVLGDASSNSMRDLIVTTTQREFVLRWDGFQYLPEQQWQ